LPEITTREKWLIARREFLVREKSHTREGDVLNAARRQLPMVEITSEYTFDGPDGPVTLAEMFRGRRQLIIQHIMFGPGWEAPCPGCSAGVDEIAPALLRHLGSRDTTFAGVSRAPYAEIGAAREAKGWLIDWYSSHGSDFNYDFGATVDPGRPRLYTCLTGADPEAVTESTEISGVSCFLRDGDAIFHTYSTGARGTDQLGSAYSLLDLTAFGRSERWEEPRGRAPRLHGADPTFTD
jgi:predicted dithiol-disulfide oxidoreductase (DUF899 family)